MYAAFSERYRLPGKNIEKIAHIVYGPVSNLFTGGALCDERR